ncbi:EamA-like transporter family-domain-containing protein [Cytidiella melzeri]|nr:EamA-like transporter family-domain-containing protein [Cytidiella melzeri]
MTTSRATYDASTPERLSFAASAHDRVTFVPAPLAQLPQKRSWTERVQGRLRATSYRIKQALNNNAGLLYIGSSQAFFSLMNVFVKKLNSLDPPVPPLELILVRMAITWICCITYMLLTKVPHPFIGPSGVRMLLALRGFVGFFGLFGVYYSLQYLSLSDATVLTFLAPMFTIATGAFFLGEKANWKQAVAGLCSLVGVILIARPAFLFGKASQDMTLADGTGDAIGGTGMELIATPSQRLGAVGVAMLGVLGATGAYTTIRAIGTRAHPMHNLVSFSGQCVIVTVVGILIMQVKMVFPMRWDWLIMLLLIGIFGFCAQVLLTMGLQRETVGRGTMAVYVQIVFATVFEQIFFHTTPSPLSIVGTVIIMSAALYVALTKEDPGRHKRANSLAAPMEDISLEEGLLANQDELDSEPEADDKVQLQAVVISASHKVPDKDRDDDKSVAP